jgi:hypothetical protein
MCVLGDLQGRYTFLLHIYIYIYIYIRLLLECTATIPLIFSVAYNYLYIIPVVLTLSSALQAKYRVNIPLVRDLALCSHTTIPYDRRG